MPTINDPNAALQQAQLLSARLGQLAAGLPRTRSQPPGPAPSRLSAVLAHLGQRPTAAEDAAKKLKTNEFIIAD